MSAKDINKAAKNGKPSAKMGAATALLASLVRFLNRLHCSA